jgi:hypothetical protein
VAGECTEQISLIGPPQSHQDGPSKNKGTTEFLYMF